MRDLTMHGIEPKEPVHRDPTTPQLYEFTLRRGEGQLAHKGPLVVDTVPYTGRSPKDKFVVREPSTENDIFSPLTLKSKILIPVGSMIPL